MEIQNLYGGGGGGGGGGVVQKLNILFPKQVSDITDCPEQDHFFS